MVMPSYLSSSKPSVVTMKGTSLDWKLKSIGVNTVITVYAGFESSYVQFLASMFP